MNLNEASDGTDHDFVENCFKEAAEEKERKSSSIIVLPYHRELLEFLHNTGSPKKPTQSDKTFSLNLTQC